MLREALQRYYRRRFAWLFFSLLLTLGANAALETVGLGVSPLELLLAGNLAAAIASVARDRHIRVLLVLGAAYLTVRSIQAVVGIERILPLSSALWVAAGVVAIAATARHALGGRAVVDSERIFAALDVYLLAGLLFGVCYWVLEQSSSASFGSSSASDLELAHAVYFSFVTIATLGYGDIVPASETARGLVILEAVGGQMYLAVLVARLVSLYSKQADD